MRLPLLVLLLGLAAAPNAQVAEIDLGGRPAPEVVVRWDARVVPDDGRPGVFRLELMGTIVDGWRVYGMGPSVAGRPLEVTLAPLPAGFSVVSQPREVGRPQTGRDPVLGVEYPYFDGGATVVAELRAGRRAPSGRHVVRGTVRYAACDDRICLAPRTEPFEVAVRIGRSSD